MLRWSRAGPSDTPAESPMINPARQDEGKTADGTAN